MANFWATRLIVKNNEPFDLFNNAAMNRLVLVTHLDANTVDKWLFVADRNYQIVSASEVHTVAGSDGSAVTADLKKSSIVQAPASGTTMLAATFNLKSTANTKVNATVSATVANTKLATGDLLGLDVTGTLTALVGGVIVIVLKPIK